MVKIWLYDANLQTISEIDFKRTNISYDYILLGPAYAEIVHPCEYHIVQKLLGAENHLHVAPYTVRTTKNYVYKVWTKDLIIKENPGVRLFDASAVFHDKVLVVKYERKTLPEFEIEKITPYVLDTSIPLFYEPANLYDCEIEPKYEWVLQDNTQSYVSIIYHLQNKVEDLMFTCAFCEKPCKQLKCSRCKKVCYCNINCQKQHWLVHKITC
jgi:hypothetical protein